MIMFTIPRVGIEPTRLSPSDPKSDPFTTLAPWFLFSITRWSPLGCKFMGCVKVIQTFQVTEDDGALRVGLTKDIAGLVQRETEARNKLATTQRVVMEQRAEIVQAFGILRTQLDCKERDTLTMFDAHVTDITKKLLAEMSALEVRAQQAVACMRAAGGKASTATSVQADCDCDCDCDADVSVSTNVGIVEKMLAVLVSVQPCHSRSASTPFDCCLANLRAVKCFVDKQIEDLHKKQKAAIVSRLIIPRKVASLKGEWRQHITFTRATPIMFQGLTISRDGRLLVAWCENVFTVLNLPSPHDTHVFLFGEPDQRPAGVCLSVVDQRVNVVVAGHGGLVELTEAGKFCRTIHESSRVLCVGAAKNMIVAGEARRILVFDAVTANCTLNLDLFPGDETRMGQTLAVFPDGCRVAIGTNSQHVFIFNLKTGEEMQCFKYADYLHAPVICIFNQDIVLASGRNVLVWTSESECSRALVFRRSIKYASTLFGRLFLIHDGSENRIDIYE